MIIGVLSVKDSHPLNIFLNAFMHFYMFGFLAFNTIFLLSLFRPYRPFSFYILYTIFPLGVLYTVSGTLATRF